MNDKHKLIDALESCIYMQTPNGRDIIVDELSFKGNIRHNEVMHIHVTSIVTVCLKHPNGLAELLESLRYHEGDSLPMRNLLALMEQLTLPNSPKPIPPHPIIPSPPPPYPDTQLLDKLKNFFSHYYRTLVVGIILFVIITIIFVGWKNLSISIPSKSTDTFNQTPISPTPEPTLIPISKLTEIKRDDFNSDKTGWDTYDKDNSSTGYQNGEYFVELKEQSVIFVSIWGSSGKIKEGILQVEVRGPFGTRGAEQQGLLWGWQSNSQLPHYAFTVNEMGKCGFYQSKGNFFTSGRTPSGIVPYSTPESESKGNQSRILNVVIKGNDVYGYIDGIFCASYTMPDYEPGLVGVVASSPDGKGKSFFDNYKIFKLPD